MAQLFVFDEAHRPIAEGYQVYQPPHAGFGGVFRTLFLALFPLFGAFVLIMAIGSTIRDVQQKQALQQSGMRVQGTVLFTDIESDSDGGIAYYISYQYPYTPFAGRPMIRKHRESVSQEVYRKTKQGDPISVIYLPQDATVVHLIGNDRIEPLWIALEGLFFVVWSSIFCGMPLAFLIGGFQTARKRERMATGGQLIMGEVREWRADTDSDGDYMIKLKYTFQDPFGRLVEDKVSGQYNSLKGKPQPTPGTPLAIWYLDDKAYEVL